MNSKQYKAAIAELFQEWEKKEHHAKKIFVKDGVINPEIFYSSEIRPLFLLKEAYGKDNSNNDIAAEHNCNIGKDCDQDNRTWPNISQWTYALLNTTKEKAAEYKELECFKKKKNEYLQKIAVVNIKKSSGTSTSVRKNLRDFVEKDKELLREQIALIKPTIIVCGYTLSHLKVIFPELKMHNKELKENHFTRININGNEVLILDCYHPSNWWHSRKQLFDMLIGVYQNALL